ncbi:response regulator [Thermodesulfobacteriota bacterium]
MMVILVVDDEMPICELLREFLSQMGHQVITASSGEQGIEKLRENRPEALFLDIRMPGMNGIDVLRKIRDTDKDLSIIMLSGFGDYSTVQQAYKTGANHYVQKPIELDHVIKILDIIEN